MDQRMDSLERNQQEVKLKLDNLARKLAAMEEHLQTRRRSRTVLLNSQTSLLAQGYSQPRTDVRSSQAPSRTTSHRSHSSTLSYHSSSQESSPRTTVCSYSPSSEFLIRSQKSSQSHSQTSSSPSETRLTGGFNSQVLSESQATFPSSPALLRADSLSLGQSTKPSRSELFSSQTIPNKDEVFENQGQSRTRREIELSLVNKEEKSAVVTQSSISVDYESVVDKFAGSNTWESSTGIVHIEETEKIEQGNVGKKLQGIISAYTNATEELIKQRWIPKIEKHGCVVRSYNGLQGFTSESDCGLDQNSESNSSYHVAQKRKLDGHLTVKNKFLHNSGALEAHMTTLSKEIMNSGNIKSLIDEVPTLNDSGMDRRGSTKLGLNIDGNVKQDENKRQIQQFMEVNSHYMILLLRTRDDEWEIYLSNLKSEKQLDDGETALGSCEEGVEIIVYPKILDGVQQFVSEKRISYVRVDGQFSIQPFHNSKEAEEKAHRQEQKNAVNLYILYAKDAPNGAHWQNLLKIVNIGILAEAYGTSLDISSAAEMFVISKDLVLKFLVQPSVKYWEGRGARMKWKWKIMAVSYHPP